MSRFSRTFALAVSTTALLVGLPASAKDKLAPHVYGPPPTWEQFRAIAEPALAARLIDPSSAQIIWAGGFYKGTYGGFLTGRYEGYTSCGTINGKNRFGGYAGAVGFIVVVDYGRVLFAGLGNPRLDLEGGQCAKAVEQGLLPPLPTSTGATPASASGSPVAATAGDSEPAAPTGAGLTLRAMPDGAYVSSVVAGSTGSAAGLKPGMVITAINGIPLAGMGEAMVKVAGAAGQDATMTLVDGRTVKLGAKP